VSDPFRFLTRFNLTVLLGRQAKNARELLEGIKEVPGSSIYYHTHRFIQQHHYLSPEPPNDFAFWATNALSRDALGEALASVDTVKFHKIESLRESFVTILESFLLDENGRGGDCQEGEEFHFMSCRTFILPTRHVAKDLREFRTILRNVGVSSLYYHIFEAGLRFDKAGNDFSHWFEAIGEKDLARAVSRLDPYTMTLEGLRTKIIHQVSRHVPD